MGIKTRREYSLSEIFSLIMKRFWVIVLCTALCTAAAYFISNYVIEKDYTASVSMYVAPNQSDPETMASLSDLYYAQQVVQTYIEILKTDEFLRAVIKASGLNYSVGALKEMIRIEAVNETEIFQVRVTSNNPRYSLNLAYTIASLAPQKIIEIKDADAVRVVDQATLPLEPTSPNIKINTLIGLFLGAALSIIGILLFDMLDNRIKDEDDIIKRYNIPVLGSVPRFKVKEGA